jgi:AcrR family transcriptional regulator
MPLARFANLDPAKRIEILRVATEEFVERGYENASLNRIIGRSGMSKGALYYYFSDKDDLYRTMLEAYSENLIEIWSGGPSEKIPEFSGLRAPEEYWEKWRAHWRRSLGYHRENPLYSALFGQCIQARASGTSHPALDEIATKLREWTREVLRRGQRIRAVRTDLPEDLLLETSFAMMEGFDRWLVEQRKTVTEGPVEELAALIVGFLRRIVEPLPKKARKKKTTARKAKRSSHPDRSSRVSGQTPRPSSHTRMGFES